MRYTENKGLGETHVQKVNREKFIVQEDLKKILAQIDSERKTNPAYRRDHALIYLGFYLALRVGEVAQLNRRHFRDVGKETVYVPTLKQSIKIPWSCSDCNLRIRLNSNRIGEKYTCPRCKASKIVKCPPNISEEDLEKNGPPEKTLPFIETFVIEYVQDYLKKAISKDEQWLFPSNKSESHIGEKQVLRIFGTYVIKAGLAPCYSFHSLRHGRCTMLWDTFHDLILVRDFARHHNTTTTEIYTRFSPEKNQSAIDQLNKIGEKNALSRSIK